MKALLHLERVSCRHAGDPGVAGQVLKDVTFTVNAGEMLVVFGRSGGGKTTLLRLMNRLADPAAGTIHFLGEALDSYPPGQLRRSIMLLPQKAVMFPGSVRDNILLPLRLSRHHDALLDADLLRSTLDQCQLAGELLERAAADLSIGQQQRVALARALITRPKLILADEPTSALDRPTAQQIAETLRRYAHSDGKASVMISHDLELSERVADRMLFLEGGEIIEQGVPRELLTRPQSEKLRRFLEQSSGQGPP